MQKSFRLGANSGCGRATVPLGTKGHESQMDFLLTCYWYTQTEQSNINT